MRDLEVQVAGRRLLAAALRMALAPDSDEPLTVPSGPSCFVPVLLPYSDARAKLVEASRAFALTLTRGQMLSLLLVELSP